MLKKILAIFAVLVGFLFGLPAVDIILNNQAGDRFLICALAALLGLYAYIHGMIYLWKTLRWLAITFLMLSATYVFLYINAADRLSIDHKPERAPVVRNLEKPEQK